MAAETGIAMPILLRYTRQHPGRVPALGSGSQLRFPPEAVEIFRTIADESAEPSDSPRHGGFGLMSLPRMKNGTGSGQPRAEAAPARDANGSEPGLARETAANDADPQPAEAAPVSPGAAILSLGDISEQTGIPYPTLARYASRFAEKIPHVGDGRARRFPPEAVEAFKHIRATSRRGRPPGSTNKNGRKANAVTADLAERIAALEQSQESLRRELAEALEELRRHAWAPAGDDLERAPQA